MSQLGHFINFVRYIWDHADQLVILFQALPTGLQAAGVGMETAGNGAVLAGKTLGGNAALPVNAADVVQQAASAIDQCYEQVREVAKVIRDVANALDQVKVPGLTFTTHRFDFSLIGLGQWDLVTGLAIEDQSLFGPVTSNMRTQANLMENQVGGRLHTTAQRLTSMSQTLDDAGSNLKSLGDALKEGGAALKQLGT